LPEKKHIVSARQNCYAKALSTLSQKSATVAENGETTATVVEFGDSRTFLRQCGQVLTWFVNCILFGATVYMAGLCAEKEEGKLVC